MLGEDTQTLSFRGRRSRNKVSVGEPAEGSLSFLHPHRAYRLQASHVKRGAHARPRMSCARGPTREKRGRGSYGGGRASALLSSLPPLLSLSLAARVARPGRCATGSTTTPLRRTTSAHAHTRTHTLCVCARARVASTPRRREVGRARLPASLSSLPYPLCSVRVEQSHNSFRWISWHEQR